MQCYFLKFLVRSFKKRSGSPRNFLLCGFLTNWFLIMEDLWWSFLAKIVNVFQLFFQKDPSQIIDWVLNTPLKRLKLRLKLAQTEDDSTNHRDCYNAQRFSLFLIVDYTSKSFRDQPMVVSERCWYRLFSAVLLVHSTFYSFLHAYYSQEFHSCRVSNKNIDSKIRCQGFSNLAV